MCAGSKPKMSTITPTPVAPPIVAPIDADLDAKKAGEDERRHWHGRPATATVTSGGKIALNLTGNTEGSASLTATAGGSSDSCGLTVINAYRIEIDSFRRC